MHNDQTKKGVSCYEPHFTFKEVGQSCIVDTVKRGVSAAGARRDGGGLHVNLDLMACFRDLASLPLSCVAGGGSLEGGSHVTTNGTCTRGGRSHRI